ncbi:hypothetical protein D3C77_744950 [compost metagenome]
MKYFLFFMMTPYKPGSVTPDKKLTKAAELAIVFSSLLLEINSTARQTPSKA